MENPMTDTNPAWAAAATARISSTAASSVSNDSLCSSAAVKCPGRWRAAALRPARAPLAAPGDNKNNAAKLAEKPGKKATVPHPYWQPKDWANLKERRRKGKLAGP